MFFQRFPITYVLRAQEATCILSLTLFGDHIFPYGDLKKKNQSPVGACLKKLISDPAVDYGNFADDLMLSSFSPRSL